MKKTILIAGIFFLILITNGCGTGRTIVMHPPGEKISVNSLNLVMEKPTVNVPDKIIEKLHDELKEDLFVGKEAKEPLFLQGSDLTLRVQVIQFNAGSRFSRWFWGGIGNAGEATLTVQAKFYDQGGKELSSIQTEGKIGSGFFGGSFDNAIEKCAQEIATYAEKNFK